MATDGPHEAAILELMSGDARLKRRGFPSEVLALWRDLYGDTTPPRRTFTPDLYRIDRLSYEVVIIEVEHTHPITPDKLKRLATFWADWDAEGGDWWLPRVFVYKCATKQMHEVDMPRAYYETLGYFRPDTVPLLPEIARLQSQEVM